MKKFCNFSKIYFTDKCVCKDKQIIIDEEEEVLKEKILKFQTHSITG